MQSGIPKRARGWTSDEHEVQQRPDGVEIASVIYRSSRHLELWGQESICAGT
ncbi:MAG: hypothetical protein AAF658_21430 [Myxococcota bacterium]